MNWKWPAFVELVWTCEHVNNHWPLSIITGMAWLCVFAWTFVVDIRTAIVKQTQLAGTMIPIISHCDMEVETSWNHLADSLDFWDATCCLAISALVRPTFLMSGVAHLHGVQQNCFKAGQLPSGKHTKSYWKLPFIVDLPIENGDFP